MSEAENQNADYGCLEGSVSAAQMADFLLAEQRISEEEKAMLLDKIDPNTIFKSPTEIDVALDKVEEIQINEATRLRVVMVFLKKDMQRLLREYLELLSLIQDGKLGDIKSFGMKDVTNWTFLHREENFDIEKLVTSRLGADAWRPEIWKILTACTELGNFFYRKTYEARRARGELVAYMIEEPQPRKNLAQNWQLINRFIFETGVSKIAEAEVTINRNPGRLKLLKRIFNNGVTGKIVFADLREEIIAELKIFIELHKKHYGCPDVCPRTTVGKRTPPARGR